MPSDLTGELERLRSCLDIVNSYVFAKDMDGRYTYANALMCQLFGRPLSEVIGHDDSEFFALDLQSKFLKHDRLVFETGETITQEEIAVVRSSGEQRYYLTVKAPIRNALGTIVGMAGVSTDVTKSKRVEQDSEEQKLLLTTILDNVEAHIYVKGSDGRYLYANEHVCALFGVPVQQIIGRTDLELIQPVIANSIMAFDQKVFQTGKTQTHEEQINDAMGRPRRFWSIKTPISYRDHAKALIGFSTDITEHQQAELALEESRVLMNAIVDSTDNLIWSVEAESFGLLNFNAGLGNYFLTTRGMQIGKGMTPAMLFPTQPEYIDIWNGLYRRALKDGPFKIDYLTSAKTIILQLTFTLLRRDQQPFGIAVFGEDITARKASEERIQFLAYHDPLTNLPNKALVEERFNSAAHYSHTQNQIAVLLLDIDHFMEVNDALGHKIGDQLIQAVAGRLVATVRPGDTVGRLGGDDFLLLLSEVQGPAEVADISSNLNACFAAPFEIGGQTLSITVSIGIALCPHDAQDLEGLMKKADTALFVVKDAGRNDFRFFDDSFNSSTVEALAMKSELRQAVDRHEFVLHYQPQVDLSSKQLLGVEALVRWQSPHRGLVPPAAFIPLAEESGLIEPIGAWVLQEACRQVAQWQQIPSWENITVAVNLSAVQFLRGDLMATIMTALDASGLAPDSLELEVTESVLVRDQERVTNVVQQIRRLGIRLAIDDFGTGYSSLSYLKRFPVSKLKIDQSFVRNMTTSSEDAEIVRATIQMGHALGLKTIAEGIEDETTAHFLRLQHCDQAQGYYFGYPVPADEFSESYLSAGPATRDNSA